MWLTDAGLSTVQHAVEVVRQAASDVQRSKPDDGSRESAGEGAGQSPV